jgi:hypothetical protein
MKHKTWFRLVIRAIGVLLVGLGAPDAIATAVYTVWVSIAQPYGQARLADMWMLPSLLANVLQAALGLYLYFGANWVVNKAIPTNRPYCPECGYDMAAAQGPACPECGAALPGVPHGGAG